MCWPSTITVNQKNIHPNTFAHDKKKKTFKCKTSLFWSQNAFLLFQTEQNILDIFKWFDIDI